MTGQAIGTRVAGDRAEGLQGPGAARRALVAWSVSEFREATRAHRVVLEWGEEAIERWLPHHGEAAGDRWDPAHNAVQAEHRWMLAWFRDRYRSEPPHIARSHWLRYLGIRRFLAVHMDELFMEGWLEDPSTSFSSIHRDLARALVTIHYEEATASNAVPLFDPADVTRLANEFGQGRTVVARALDPVSRPAPPRRPSLRRSVTMPGRPQKDSSGRTAIQSSERSTAGSSGTSRPLAGS